MKLKTKQVRKIAISTLATLGILGTNIGATFAQTALVIYNAKTGNLAQNYDIGVDTSNQRRKWLEKKSDNSMCMTYPPGQSWGAVFIVYGGLKPLGDRSGIDLSNYKTLAIQMKGQNGGEEVNIGLKDKKDPDNGSETKITQTLTSEYKTYTFPLSDFSTADLKNLYVVTEFVFEPGTPSQTVCFRNVEFRR